MHAGVSQSRACEGARANSILSRAVSRCETEAEIHVMIPRSTKQPGRPDEAYQPLLNNDDEDVLFNTSDGDSEDDFEVPVGLPDPLTGKRSVRFEEDVQVIAPSLRSTTASREAGSCAIALVNYVGSHYGRIRPRLRGARRRDLCPNRFRRCRPAHALASWPPRFNSYSAQSRWVNTFDERWPKSGS
jgi:hypothetical protein